MLYDAYQFLADIGENVRGLAANTQAFLSPWSDKAYASPLKRMAAFNEVVALAGFTHKRPDYGIKAVEVGGSSRAVTEEVAFHTPFCEPAAFS